MDAFTTAYLEAALWVNDPVPESGEYQADLSQVPEDYQRLAVEQCAEFQRHHAELLAQAGTDAQNGHDFYLTRNGHGAGFWDRGYGEVGEKLSAVAKMYGETDDGELFDEQEG